MSRELFINRDPQPDKPLIEKRVVYEVNTPTRGATDILSKGDREGLLRRICESNQPSISERLYFGNGVLRSTIVSRGEIKGVDLEGEDVEKIYGAYHEGKLDDAEVVSVVKPTAPYSEGGLMMVEGPLGSCFDEDKKPHILFDASQETQRTYWEQVTNILRNSLAVSQYPPIGLEGFEGMTPLLVEHHSVEVASEEHPGIRTLGLHHGHLIFYNPKHAAKNDWDMNLHRIPTQDRLMRRNREPNLSQFVKKVNERMPGTLFRSRKEASPLGYQVSVNYDDIDMFTRFMSDHYHAYKETAWEIETSLRERLGRKSEEFFKGNIIQPTYGVVLLPSDEKRATVLVTPAIVPIGPIERMGIMLKRDPGYKKHIGPGNTKEFHNIILGN